MLRIKSEILRRRQRRRMALQTEGDRRRHIAELFVLLIALITLHIGALVMFEKMAVDDAAWLTLTTVTTVGSLETANCVSIRGEATRSPLKPNRLPISSALRSES